ncbi:MFS transporter [Mycolicibacterium phlei]|uniref:MFS transporter n=1 Tax=Mycolicibacterium phlei TaxID=1771 RepID=UPI00025AD293|nr:MFS transporter [Mycolicibacterium phlei]EID14452.1 MFS transporter [Mycolicibacterium phlei RIVM601174]MBF4192396.1 MFS transporter [Mycolicibacterium phlei]
MTTRAALRPLITTVFVPSAVFGIGQGAGAPVIALVARDLGASVGVAGALVALVGLGAVLGDLPAGRVVARFGERRSIIVGSTVGAVGAALCVTAWTPAVLAVGAVLTGLSTAVWGLARQSYLAEVVPFESRARAMATFALMWRLGFFVGPFLGALVILGVGTRGGFAVQLVAIVVSGYLMVRVPDPPRPPDAAPHGVPLRDIVATHRTLLATLGTGSLLMGAARAGRDAVLPLWAHHIGLDAASASVVFGVGAAFDLLCSYPAGQLMDRYGRRSVAVPSLLIIAVSYFLLPFSATFLALIVTASVMGVGNGFGNGVIMTLGADVAPPATRAEFLAAWRLTHDAGMFLGPLAVGAAATAVPLGGAVAGLGLASTLGAGVMFRYIPRYAPWQSRAPGR